MLRAVDGNAWSFVVQLQEERTENVEDVVSVGQSVMARVSLNLCTCVILQRSVRF